MTRKSIALVMGLVLIFSLPTFSANSAAVKAGSACKKSGQSIEFNGKKYTCVKSGTKLKWNNGVIIPISIPISPSDLSVCKISDKRPLSMQHRAIAFPAEPEPGFVNTGREKIVVVGMDFSDSPGTGTPKAAIDEIVKNSTEWINWYSRKKLTWDFVTYDKWIRAPKESQVLDVAEVGADAQITREIKEEYVSEIQKVVNVEKAAAFWVIYPEDIQKIVAVGQNRQWYPIQTKDGVIAPAMFAIGKETYESKRTPWLYLVHETLHAQGLAGHSPFMPPVMGGIMNFDDSPTHYLNAWEALTLDWAEPSDTYCVEVEKLTKTLITLVPIEREQKGISSVMIKLDGRRVLVVESHRVDKWSPLLNKQAQGVMTYIVDTAVDNRNKLFEAPATYVKLSGVNHGVVSIQGKPVPGYENFGIHLVNGVGIVQNSWDLNYVMYQGESLTSNGVKISLVKSGSNDTIQIERK